MSKNAEIERLEAELRESSIVNGTIGCKTLSNRTASPLPPEM